MLEEAERQLAFTLALQLSEDSAFTVVRNVYECFRMLGDALLVSKGLDTKDHIEPIKALLNLKVNTKRPINAIDNLRRLRHNINYYGYHPTVAEAVDTIDIANTCFKPLAEAVRKELNAVGKFTH